MKKITLIVGRNARDFGLYAKPHLNNDNKREYLGHSGNLLPVMDAISAARYANNELETRLTFAEIPDLTSLYLASYLNKRGVESIFFGSFDCDILEIEKSVNKCSPHVIVLTTSQYVTPFPLIEEILFFRQICPDAIIVVGGPLIMNLFFKFKEFNLENVLQNIGADIYINSEEGEKTLGNLIIKLNTNKDFSCLPNIAWKSADGWRINGIKKENNDLNEEMVDWSLLSNLKKNKTVFLRTASGCLFNCSFCDRKFRTGGCFKTISTKNFRKELLCLKNRGVENIFFIDESFNVPNDRFLEFISILKDFDFSWYSYLRCDRIEDEKIFRIMRESGCSGVSLGIESGSDAILKNMNKMASRDGFERGILGLNEQGIITVATIIVGFPGETEKTVEETINFINSTNPQLIKIRVWSYLDQAPIALRHNDFNIKIKERYWTHQGMNLNKARKMADLVFCSLEKSLVTNTEIGPWAIPYLLGKGMTFDQIFKLHDFMNQYFQKNDAILKGLEFTNRNLDKDFENFAIDLDVLPGNYSFCSKNPLDDNEFREKVIDSKLKLAKIWFS